MTRRASAAAIKSSPCRRSSASPAARASWWDRPTPDGSDGPTDVAGAIVDGYTAERAAALGIDIDEALRRHDSHTALHTLGETIDTGILTTNVRDLRVIYVAGAER